MKHLQLGLIMLLPALACYSTSDSFNKRAAKLSCVNMKECQKSAYENEFDSMGDCQDQLKEVFDDLFASCQEYDASQGRSCIHTMYKSRKKCIDATEEEQEQNQEACEGVYSKCLDDDNAAAALKFESVSSAIDFFPSEFSQEALGFAAD